MSFPLTFTQPPGVVQCGTANLLWSGGTPPYTVSPLSAQSTLDSHGVGTVASSFNPHLEYSPVAVLAGKYIATRCENELNLWRLGTLIKFRVTDSSTPVKVADTRAQRSPPPQSM